MSAKINEYLQKTVQQKSQGWAQKGKEDQTRNQTVDGTWEQNQYEWVKTPEHRDNQEQMRLVRMRKSFTEIKWKVQLLTFSFTEKNTLNHGG